MDINLRQIHTRHKVLHLFLIIFLGCSAAVVAVASLFYHQERTLHFDAIRSAEQSTIDLQSIAIGDEFDIIVSDLLFLSRQNELLNSFDDPASAPDSGMENTHWFPSKWKQAYIDYFKTSPHWVKVIAGVVIVFMIYQMRTADIQPFIYFQF